MAGSVYFLLAATGVPPPCRFCAQNVSFGRRGCFIIALAAGFSVACLLAWAYELAADGIQRDPANTAPDPDASPTRLAARQTASWETLLVGTVVPVVYWHQYHLENAMDAFERILALGSTRGITQSNLATAYFYLGRYDKAARLYAKASAQYPKTTNWSAP